MVRLRQLPFFKLALAWILGIFLHQKIFHEGHLPMMVLFACSFLLLVMDLKRMLPPITKAFKVRSIAIALCIVSGSWLFTYTTHPSQSSFHIVHQPHYQYVLVEIEEISYKQDKLHKVVSRIASAFNKGQQIPMEGKLLCYNRDTALNSARLGDYWMLPARVVQSIDAPSNPGQFNYAAYMANKGIYHQAFLRAGEAQQVGHSQTALLRKWLHGVRKKVAQSLNYLPSNEQALAKALLVGVKDDLSTEMKSDFSKTGAMHVLAVSGLHVGIIFWILNKALLFLLGFKVGRFLRLGLLLLGLWAYALITGLPPSVQRATLMFSLIALAAELQRAPNTLNTVLLTAFTLLAYQPNLLQDVGFQLSYSAVFGIIILQPVIAKWWRPKLWILKYAWDILSVSIAAQCATLPITLYYFHQFPVWFLLSNLVAIPAAFFVVTGGILLQLAGLLGTTVLSGFQWVYQMVLSFFLKAIGFIAELPWSHIHHISIDLLDVAFLLVALLLVGMSMLQQRLIYFKWALFVLIVQQVTHIVQSQFLFPKYEFVVFNTGKNATCGLKSPKRTVLFTYPEDATDHSFNTDGFFIDRPVVDSLPLGTDPRESETSFFAQQSLQLPGHRIHFLGRFVPDTSYFDHFIIHRSTPSQLITQLPPKKCVFDSSVRDIGFLAKYPNFATAHFVSRDGAFLIQTQ